MKLGNKRLMIACLIPLIGGCTENQGYHAEHTATGYTTNYQNHLRGGHHKKNGYQHNKDSGYYSVNPAQKNNGYYTSSDSHGHAVSNPPVTGGYSVENSKGYHAAPKGQRQTGSYQTTTKTDSSYSTASTQAPVISPQATTVVENTEKPAVVMVDNTHYSSSPGTSEIVSEANKSIIVAENTYSSPPKEETVIEAHPTTVVGPVATSEVSVPRSIEEKANIQSMNGSLNTTS